MVGGVVGGCDWFNRLCDLCRLEELPILGRPVAGPGVEAA
jgi:hypothetical protein